MQTSDTTFPAEPTCANGIGSVVQSVERHLQQREARRHYQSNVYEIFQAIGAYQEKNKEAPVSDAVFYVVSGITNRPHYVTPVVSFETPFMNIVNTTRAYEPTPDDEFNPFYKTMREFVTIYDAYVPYVEKTMAHLSVNKPAITAFALSQSAESWGEHHDRQIAFRASEIRGHTL